MGSRREWAPLVQVTLPRGLKLPQETPLSGSQPYVVVARDSEKKEGGRGLGEEGGGEKTKKGKRKKKNVPESGLGFSGIFMGAFALVSGF